MTKLLNAACLALLICFQFTACTQSTETIPEIDPVYGVALDEVYKDKGVKEVFVEREQFYERKLVYPRYLSRYLLLDKEGRTIRKETAHDNRIARRLDTAYDADGSVLSTISYAVKPGSSHGKTGREGIDWVYAEKTLHVPNGTETAGKYTWHRTRQQWHQVDELRTWQSNDTTYTEKRSSGGIYGHAWVLTRVYWMDADKSILRQDELTFTPEGMYEPRYSYTKMEDGKVKEHGVVDYENELYAYVEKNPAKQRFMLSEHGYSTVLDELARQSPGRLEPEATYRYNSDGGLVLAHEYNTEITYERDAAGRATAKRERHTGGAGGTISRYYYNAEGLLTHEVKTSLRGEPSETLYYRYTFR